jgi:hypothetical protein
MSICRQVATISSRPAGLGISATKLAMDPCRGMLPWLFGGFRLDGWSQGEDHWYSSTHAV